MMLFLFFALPVLVAMTIDLLRYRRGLHSRRQMIGWMIADSLPLWIGGLFFFVDNTPILTQTMMWSIWLWMLLCLPRMISHLFSALRLRRIGYALALVIIALLIYGAGWGRRDLHIHEEAICSARLPRTFDGFRIAHFTDLHLGALVDTEREVGQLVEQINALQPDLVCFTGDLVNIRHSELDDRAQRLLRGIKAPVVSVLGNHDVGSYIRDTVHLPREESLARLIERQQQMGWLLLQDSTCYLRRGNDSICISGLSFDPMLRKERHDSDLPLTGGERCYQGVPDSLFNLTLVHVPQLWEQIVALGYGDLTLAGHTHAMQLKIRVGNGRGWSPAAWLYKRWSGRYELNGHTLYINDGIGYVGYPMRIGARPEITLYTLRRCE